MIQFKRFELAADFLVISNNIAIMHQEMNIVRYLTMSYIIVAAALFVFNHHCSTIIALPQITDLYIYMWSYLPHKLTKFRWSWLFGSKTIIAHYELIFINYWSNELLTAKLY